MKKMTHLAAATLALLAIVGCVSLTQIDQQTPQFGIYDPELRKIQTQQAESIARKKQRRVLQTEGGHR